MFPDFGLCYTLQLFMAFVNVFCLEIAVSKSIFLDL
jgi:hypothetical protein